MLLIIFGAGASYDYSKEALAAQNYPRMPLANGLIASSSLPAFHDATRRWPGVVPLLRRLRELEASQPTFNLEEALYTELQRGHDGVTAQLMSFRFYVHEILCAIQSSVMQSSQGDTNYSRLLDKLQQADVDTRLGIALVNFNYDNLLDIACNQNDPRWQFVDFNDYISGNPNIKLYKPHGSLDWTQYKRLLYQPGTVNKIKVFSDPDAYELIDNGVRIQSTGHDNFIQGSDTTEPVIALPYKEKTNFVFPNTHEAELKQDMNEVSHILTIGWRGSEQHFHNKILTNIPDTTKVKILNVNTGSGDIEENLKKSLGQKIAAMSTFTGGFTEFLNHPRLLENFCK